MNLTRTLIALIITLTILPISATSFSLVSKISFQYDEINDEIALNDLRNILLLGYDIELSDTEINFIYKNDEYNLSLTNNRLVLSPGYQMFLNDVDDLRFEEKNNCVYVLYQRGNKEYERIIASTQGFYLEQFSDCANGNTDDSEFEN